MNVILDTLFLRKPRIEYVSPPICEAQFSSSGGPVIILPDILRHHGPTGGRAGGRGRRFFSFDNVPGQICFQIYEAIDPNNPDSPYNLISECVPNGSIALCSEGYYEISAIDGQGHESARSSPIAIPGGGYTIVALPVFPQTVAYNLYKSSNGPSGPYSLYWYAFSGSSFEVCTPGCYRITAITGDGETPLSDHVCTDFDCSPLTCPPGTGWNAILCECVPCGLITSPCEPGFTWNAASCTCIPDGGGGGDTTDLDGCLGDMFGETTLAPDGFTGPCTFVYAGDPLPTGLVFAQESPISANVSGIPTVSGTFHYNITVTSANNRVAIFYYKLITFGFTNANPPSGATTTPYTFDFTASGGTAPLTFSIISGSLPDGLSMNSAGHVSGTPTTNQTSTFEVQVVDSSTDQEICSRSYSIAISDGECAGVPSNIADLTWTISPADPGNTMAGGTGTFNALSPGVGPCFQLSTSQGFTSRICNPTDNPVTLTWHIPAWEADGNVCNYIAGQDGVIFNMELYDSIPGSGSSIQSPLRDLVTGPFTPFTLSLVLPAHSVKHILLELIVRCSPDTGLGGVQILSLGNMTLT